MAKELYTYRGKPIVFERGISKTELQLESVADFMRFLEENRNFPGFLFRGQSQANDELKPSLHRNPEIYRKYKKLEAFRELLFAHLERFRFSLRGRLEVPLEYWKDDMEMWAIAQHYGMKTPLLDWTGSPWVALYFAFENQRELKVVVRSNDTEESLRGRFDEQLTMFDAPRAVYFYNAGLMEQRRNACYEKHLAAEAAKLDPSDRHDGNERVHAHNVAESKARYLFPLVIAPKSGKNHRLVNQRGLFTYLMFRASIEGALSLCTATHHVKSTDPMLIKATLPNGRRTEILKHLYDMNISRLSLFPDVEGAAAYENWRLDKAVEEAPEPDPGEEQQTRVWKLP